MSNIKSVQLIAYGASHRKAWGSVVPAEDVAAVAAVGSLQRKVEEAKDTAAPHTTQYTNSYPRHPGGIVGEADGREIMFLVIVKAKRGRHARA